MIEVSEWQHVGSAIANIAAAYPSSLHYRIIDGNGEAEIFIVSPTSGVLSLATALDYEQTSWYNLTIQATNAVSIQLTYYPRRMTHIEKNYIDNDKSKKISRFYD